MPCEMLITWKRYAGHIVARMKQHHKCTGCTAWGCTAWCCTAWGCTAWCCTAWRCTAWGCTAWGCTAYRSALHGVALHGVVLHGAALHVMHRMGLHCMGLHCMGCIVYRLYFYWFGGGGAIQLRRACLIKLQFNITVINADCRITNS